jgi:hypothetical protein
VYTSADTVARIFSYIVGPEGRGGTSAYVADLAFLGEEKSDPLLLPKSNNVEVSSGRIYVVNSSERWSTWHSVGYL